MKIYKYELGIGGSITEITAPIVQFLKVDWQNGTGPVAWAIIDDDNEESYRTYRVASIGTGWDCPTDSDYIGTIQDDMGYVWHYFIIKEQTTEALNTIAISAEEFAKAISQLQEALSSWK